MADDFTGQLNAVLGNPEAMGQIMSIARALTGDGAPPAQQTAPEAEYVPAESFQSAPAALPPPKTRMARAHPRPTSAGCWACWAGC